MHKTGFEIVLGEAGRLFISRVKTKDDALRAAAEIHAAAAMAGPEGSYGGVSPEGLICGEEAIEAALALGYIRRGTAGGAACLHTTGAGREALARAADPWGWILSAVTLRRRTLAGWSGKIGIKIIDPDGFDRRDPRLFRRRFTREEFLAGLPACTVEYDRQRLERKPGYGEREPLDARRGRRRTHGPKSHRDYGPRPNARPGSYNIPDPKR